MLSLLWLLFLAGVNAYADPGLCVKDCWTHDPGLYQRRSDGKYFRFATGGGIHVSTSYALEGPWSEDGYALQGGSIIDHPGNTNLWAPDVHYQDGMYYLYYSVSILGSQDSVIGVASSDSMEVGTWTDHGSTGLSSTPSNVYNAIDANWIQIGDTSYLNFGSYWHDLYQVKMDSPLRISSETPYNVAYNATGGNREEASFMVEHDGYYYLFFSSGIANGYATSIPPPGEEYRINVCRSECGLGEFVDRDGTPCVQGGGTTVLASHDYVYAPGGQGVMNDADLGLVLYYHYVNEEIGLQTSDYQFGYNQLQWDDGWPSV